MKLRLYERADAPEVLRLWNTAGAAAGYAPLDAGKLDELLLAHPAFCGESTFVLEESGAILGFAAGCTGDTLAQGAVRGYVGALTGIITDITTGKTYKAQPFPPFIQKIIAVGGIENFVREKIAGKA